MEKTKHGTVEELKKDMESCGFRNDPSVANLVGVSPDADAIPATLTLDTALMENVMASTRMKIDNAMQTILQESGLPLYLFDYLVTSVQADIRKADMDLLRASIGSKPPEGGDT